MSEQIETAAELSAVFDAWYNARNPQSVKNVGGRTVKVASFDETYGLANGVMNLFDWAEAQEKRIDDLEAANAGQAKTIKTLENRLGALADYAAETRRAVVAAEAQLSRLLYPPHVPVAGPTMAKASQPAPVPVSPTNDAGILAELERWANLLEAHEDDDDWRMVANLAGIAKLLRLSARRLNTASQPAPDPAAPIAEGMASVIVNLSFSSAMRILPGPELAQALREAIGVSPLIGEHGGLRAVRVVIYPAEEVQP